MWPKTNQLPPEIWLEVFAYATFIPGALTCEDDQAITSFARDKYGISLHRRYRETMDIKLAACLVCRSWRSLIIEFLFQYLLIPSGSRAMEIAAALNRGRSPSYMRGIRIGPGRWTIRLELALEGIHVWTDDHANALLRILQSCPNVTIFSTAFCTADAYLFHGPQFTQMMVEVRSRSNLRRLELRGDTPLLEKMVSRLAPSLEVLWLLPARRISTMYGKHNIHFPKLRTFILSEGFGWGAPPPTWTVPSLQILFTDDDDFSTASLSNLYRFMKTNGHQLRHLIACRSTVCNLQFCSNLLEWTLPCGMVHLAFRMSDQCHPSIRCLTLIDDMCCNYTMKLDHVFILHKWVVDAFFPALECIRFLLPLGRLVRQYRPRTEWTQAFELLTNACRIRAIRLEVSIGADDHTAGIWQPFFVDQLLL